jgi:hypothetical protein
MYLLNGSTIDLTRAQIINGSQWPAGELLLSRNQSLWAGLGITQVADPTPTLAETQLMQETNMDMSYQTTISSNVSYMNTTFQSDSNSKNTLAEVLLGLNGSTPTGFYWLDANNNQVVMNYTQLQGLAQAMMAQGWAAFQNLQIKKMAIRAATDIATAQAITW